MGRDAEIVLLDKQRTQAVVVEEEPNLVVDRHPLALSSAEHLLYHVERALGEKREGVIR